MAVLLWPAAHLLFDVDGLLLDTEQLRSVVFQDICDRYEKEYTWDVKSLVMGKALEVAQVVVDVLRLLVSKEELLEERQARLRDLFPTVALIPGAEKLILHLRKQHPLRLGHQLRVRILRGEDKQAQGTLQPVPSHRAGRRLEVKSCKPDPAVFLACARRFSPPPPVEECLVFEDARKPPLLALPLHRPSRQVTSSTGHSYTDTCTGSGPHGYLPTRQHRNTCAQLSDSKTHP